MNSKTNELQAIVFLRYKITEFEFEIKCKCKSIATVSDKDYKSNASR